MGGGGAGFDGGVFGVGVVVEVGVFAEVLFVFGVGALGFWVWVVGVPVVVGIVVGAVTVLTVLTGLTVLTVLTVCLLYPLPSPPDRTRSRMPSYS